MSYIWEQPNRGSTLYEMAIIKQRSLMEYAGPTGPDEPLKFKMTDAKNNDANANMVISALSKKFGVKPEYKEGFIVMTKEDFEKCKEGVRAYTGGGFLEKNPSVDYGADGDAEPTGRPYRIHDAKMKDRVETVLNQIGAKYKLQEKSPDEIIVLVANADDENVKSQLDTMVERNFLDDAREQSEVDSDVHNKREAVLAKIISQFPDDVKLKVSLGCYNLADGKWIDGTPLEPGSKNAKTAETFLQAVTKGNEEQARTALSSIETAISDGRIKVDPANSGLYSVQNIEKQVTGNIRMPAMFDAEPDDTMWNEIVITDYGIPMVNLSHPAVKKVIASDNPEEECPGDLKLVKEKIYGNKRLQLVFGKGGFERMLGKAFNFLTLGVAAATTDAGKRADRIIKELKEKGAMTTHRNLLLAKFDDIVDADPENPDIRIPAKAYNRGTKQFVGDVEVPVAMLGRFYSAVDPIKSSKIYIEMYNNKKCGDYGMAFSESAGKAGTEEKKATEGKVEAAGVAGYPLVEYCGANRGATQQKPLYEYILCTALAVAAAAAVPQVKNLITGIKGGKKANGVNTPDAGGDPTGKQFAGLKKQFVEYLDKEGHPPSYVLKPKSANKEVVIISKASTGHAQGGKVLMVTLKVDDHQAACFMTPAECKKYFSV